MPKITNISAGPRGVNTEDGIVFLQPGQSRDDLKIADGELKSLSEEWFRVGATAKGDVDKATEAEAAAKAEAERKAKAEAAAKAGQ